MKKIVIIGASDFQLPLLMKAKEMGFEAHVFAWEEGSVATEQADHFYPISIVEKEEILDVCRQIKPDAVVTIASDLANITVQYICKKLGLPCNSDDCIEKSTNKYTMRCAFKENGVSTPEFATVSSKNELDLSRFTFPVIVKPTDRSGSRGITKVVDQSELDAAIAVACEQSFENKAMVEEYIDGPEYSCECISYNGKHMPLAITKKFTTGAPHFIEIGHIEPADIDNDMQKMIIDTVFVALDALGVKNGASHSEFKITPSGDVRIIEIGSRMGGDCIGSHLVYLSSGYDFLKMVIDTALGNEPDITPTKAPSCAAIRFIFQNQDIEILERIKNNAPEALYYVSPITDVSDHEIVDSGTRFGYYIVTADSYQRILDITQLEQ